MSSAAASAEATGAAAVAPASNRDLCTPDAWTDHVGAFEQRDAFFAAASFREWHERGRKGILDLSGCGLRTLPPDLFTLRELEELILLNIKLSGIPPGLAQLTNLHMLDLTNTNLRDLSGEVLAALPKLRILSVAQNSLSTLPPELFELPLETLSLESCGIEGALPDALWDMTTLNVLNIGNCGLVTLPPALGNLVHLKHLTVNSNSGLTKLPDELGQLSELEKLSCSGSGLRSLPSSLGDLTALKILYLNECRMMQRLPREICGCVSLEALHCHRSGKKSLPLELGLLPKLTYLGCTGTGMDPEQEDLLPIRGHCTKLLVYLRHRARTELSGRLVKRALPTTDEEEEEEEDSGAAAAAAAAGPQRKYSRA